MRTRQTIRLQLRWPLLGVLLCLCACSGEQETSITSQDGEQSLIDQVTETYEKAAELDSPSVVEGETENRHDALLAMLRGDKENWFENEDTVREVMGCLKDEKLGLDFLERLLPVISELSSEETIEILERIRSELPGTPMALKAFDFELDASLLDSPKNFLKRCKSVIVADKQSKESRVALYRRYEYYSRNTQPKEAALDALQFWGLFPKVVENMHAEMKLMASVREAGFLLEAELLNMAKTPEIVASSLHADFSNGSVSTGAKGDGEESISSARAYFLHAPDDRKVNSSKAIPSDSDGDNFLHYARLAKLALTRLDLDGAIGYYEAFLEEIEKVIIGSFHEKHDSAQVVLVCNVSLNQLLKVLEGSLIYDEAINGEESQVFKDTLGDLARRLSEVDLRVAQSLPGETNVATYFSMTMAHIDVLASLGSHAGVILTLDSFLNRFPAAEEAADILLAKADYLVEPLDSPSEAAQIYEKLIVQFPESELVTMARLRRGALQFEMLRYADAYDSFLTALAVAPDDELAVNAKVLLALCQDRLGLNDESEALMVHVANQHPDHPAAARAFYWLGYRSFLNNDRETMQIHFTSLIDRHPADPLAERARKILTP